MMSANSVPTNFAAPDGKDHLPDLAAPEAMPGVDEDDRDPLPLHCPIVRPVAGRLARASTRSASEPTRSFQRALNASAHAHVLEDPLPLAHGDLSTPLFNEATSPRAPTGVIPRRSGRHLPDGPDLKDPAAADQRTRRGTSPVGSSRTRTSMTPST